MSFGPKAAVAFMASVIAGCASVPRDSGFADVRRTVEAETRQAVAWDSMRQVEPTDDAAVAPLLQETLTADRAVQVAFAHNRDIQATLEGLGVIEEPLTPIWRRRIAFAFLFPEHADSQGNGIPSVQASVGPVRK